MKTTSEIALCHCPIHGYMPFVSAARRSVSERFCEQDLIDHPWVQRLRQIHQLQTAWWVFPSAEHTRFQHVMGVMHLASHAAAAFYDSLRESDPSAPSRAYVESLLRVAGLLHDVGHGPFGHFFDAHYLSRFGLTHETLGARIIEEELGEIIRGIRRNPNGALAPHECLDPRQVTFLIVRPSAGGSSDFQETAPRWLRLLRTLFCGLYTIDNMDFVLRDAYMSGYSPKVVDIDRLFYYSYFTPNGLTIDERGLSSLVHFLSIRGELFRTIYYHRTVRAVDMSLEDLFRDSGHLFLSGNPAERLAEYLDFTEWSLFVRAAVDWKSSTDPEIRALSERWRDVLNRRLPWRASVERSLFYDTRRAEKQSLFSEKDFFERKFRQALTPGLRELELRFDLARYTCRPAAAGPTELRNVELQNLVEERRTGVIRPITDDELLRQLPFISMICRVYSHTAEHDAALNLAMDSLLRETNLDDATNI